MTDKVRDACQAEVIRQGFEGELLEDRTNLLVEAYDTACWWNGLHDLTLDRLNGLAGVIEPTNFGKLRTTPVHFADLSLGLDADLIPAILNKWVEFFNGCIFDTDNTADNKKYFAFLITYEFLEIHPYTDGNGRLAFILYNWLLGFPEDPAPLPYFYGEHVCKVPNYLDNCDWICADCNQLWTAGNGGTPVMVVS